MTRFGKDRLGDVECDTVRYRMAGFPIDVSLWLATEKGHQPVKIVVAEGDDEATSFRQVLTADLARTATGYWFPSRVEVRQHTGRTLDWSDTIDISDVAINEPMPPSAFTFAGIGVREDTIIWTEDARRTLVWSAGKLVPYEQRRREWDAAKPAAGLPPEPVPIDPPARPRYWLYAVAAGLVVAAVLLLARAVRRAS